MKIRRSRHNVAQAPAPGPKAVAAAPTPRRTIPGPPPRVWSLLLPPGFTNDRR